MIEQAIEKIGRRVALRARYGNFIGGAFVDPVEGRWFENATPIDGRVLCEVARSGAQDVELALDAAHRAREGWARTPVAERARILNRIADRLEDALETLALVETLDNGKPIRESMGADLPIAIDHFRYFAAAARAQEGTLSEIDADTIAYHYHEPLGVVGQIIPWNFPLLMAAWKLAPALAAGNCVVIKPAEQTPMSLMVMMELIADLLPPGVVNVVQGFGVEAGKPLAQSPRIAKIAFTGETSTGRLIMQYASENIIPVTLELGGKSPNIFFPDIMAADDALLDKAVEGFVMFALNQGQACTCPSRALVHASIYDAFLERALERVGRIRQGNPFDPQTVMGPQASREQLEKILGYIEIGRGEGARVLAGGARAHPGGGLDDGFYVQPTVLEGHNGMRVFREEIFGPVVGVTRFETVAEALAIANDSEYGLAAAVWSRDTDILHTMNRGLQAGRIWNNAYHLYPAHAAFGGYKRSGIGREGHKVMLDHYQQIKNVIASHRPGALGLYR
ncbi:aldehyde dehydrogenase (acceptor) [Plasticicumulans lactativorans]|uniref:Aldehyde dehydrogenase (Acceptor) n=1 Tax=Plasticicumulans lactativorans TaxID=1133106 RepID=A0A4R2L9A7_9GAMM|nr:aldehyde dehydrogenase family protein [Plasticicumulans lactativorans]TCO83351.1 aldehyde dehydrogenase (acceptor) [Plasticicumulans lactativorans]